MRRTSRLVLLAGVFLAAITFIVIVLLFSNNSVPTGGNGPTAAVDRDVVVAVVDIPLGTSVTADMVSKQKLSIPAIDSGTLQDPSQAIGRTTQNPIAAGAQVHAADFVGGGPGVADITPRIPTGMRAFAITVNELTGVGNLVNVGNKVDVLISQNVTVVQKNPDGTVATVPGIGNALTVKMPLLLENLQIIDVIDSSATAPAAPAQGQQPAASSAPVLTGGSKLLILAVTPAQAEVLLFARTTGTIDVVLRNADDTDQVATDGVILKTLIDKYGVIPPTVIITQIP